MQGRVVSIKNKNTATVLVTGRKTHPLYKKTYVFSKKFLVEDQLGVTLGQIVEIIPTKPISKRKFWKVTKVVGRDIEAIVDEQLKEQAAEVMAEVMPAESEQETVDSEQSAEEVKSEKAKVKNTNQKSQPKAGRPLDEKVEKKEKK